MNKEYPEEISLWELQKKDWQSRYRGMVKKNFKDDYVAEFRKRLPFGPPSLQRIEELAACPRNNVLNDNRLQQS